MTYKELNTVALAIDHPERRLRKDYLGAVVALSPTPQTLVEILMNLSWRPIFRCSGQLDRFALQSGGIPGMRKPTTIALWTISILLTTLLTGPGQAMSVIQEPSDFSGVRYFEIPVQDLGRAISFYEALFRIELIRQNVDGYKMALFPELTDGQGASGALAEGDVYVPAKSGPILYFTVSDMKTFLDRLSVLNATILLEPQEVQGNGVVAEFEDCEGNRIALFQPNEEPQ